MSHRLAWLPVARVPCHRCDAPEKDTSFAVPSDPPGASAAARNIRHLQRGARVARQRLNHLTPGCFWNWANSSCKTIRNSRLVSISKSSREMQRRLLSTAGCENTSQERKSIGGDSNLRSPPKSTGATIGDPPACPPKSNPEMRSSLPSEN